jgi:hemolysin activation/secretion protein
VYDGVVVNHYQNYLNERLVIGGDTRLRGYPPAAFIGKDAIAQNLEYRTRPAQIWSVQIGGAVFYDVGDAFDGFSDLRLKQSTGLGFRAVFPQAERIVFRADWGFPIEQGRLVTPGSLFVTFGQAFGMPNLPSPSLETEYAE